MKIFKNRIALLGIAAALAVCGCSVGSSDVTEAEDDPAQTTEAANDTEQAVGTAESEHPIAQDMPVWIGEETQIEGGIVSAPSLGGDDWFVRDMPVILCGEDSGETEIPEGEND